jgi:small subunit ribosomal protein S11
MLPAWRPGCGQGRDGLGMAEVELFVRDLAPGREAHPGHSSTGIRVRSIRDVTPVAHNGCRPPKKRRV